MKKIFTILCLIAALFMLSFNAFAVSAQNNWAFYVYTVDSDDAKDYNDKAVSEIKECLFNTTVGCYIESSKNSDFNNFLNFAKKNFDATHKVLIVIGKGEGVYGLQLDYQSTLSLTEIKQSLNTNFVANKEKPPFDLVFFDASLMANAEMGSVLDGYSKYYVAPESVAFEVNGFYLNFISEFLKNPGMGDMKLGRLILDTYAKCVDDHLSRGLCITTGLTLFDVKNLSKAYNAYKIVCKNALKRIAKDNLMMSHISYQSKMSVPMGETITSYKHNLIDFFDFMNKLSTYFPIETSNVIKYIGNAVIYKVHTPFMLVASGVSVYFPMYTFDKHDECLSNYLTNIADSEYISALYNYKMYGTLTKATKESLKKSNIGNIKDLNFKAVNDFIKTTIEYKSNDASFTLKPKKEIKSLIQDMKLLVFKRVDEGFVFYDEDSFAELDKYNNMVVDFHGEWSSFNGNILRSDVLADNDDFTEYATTIMHNGKEETLYYVYRYGETNPVGINIGTKRSDAFGTVVEPLKDGDKIKTSTLTLDAKKGTKELEYGNEFTYKYGTKIEDKPLPDGDYSCMIMLEDLQGVEHESAKLLFTMEKGKVKLAMSEEDLFKKYKK